MTAARALQILREHAGSITHCPASGDWLCSLRGATWATRADPLSAVRDGYAAMMAGHEAEQGPCRINEIHGYSL